MDTTQLTKVIEDYCEISQPKYAIMINGCWGVGKTFFIQNFFKEKTKRRLIYASLFGTTEPSKIDDLVFSALIGNIDTSNSEIRQAGDLLGKVFGAFGDKGTGSALGAFAATAGEALKNRALKNLGEDVVLVFDDLERAHISPYLCISKINTYVEHQNLKVIILSDEEKIDDPKYQEYKEKVVLHTNYLERSTQEICTTCFDAVGNFNHNYLERFKLEFEYLIDLLEARNLRTIIHGLNCFKSLVDTATRLNPELKHEENLVRLLPSAIILSIGYKDYSIDVTTLEKLVIDLNGMYLNYFLKKDNQQDSITTPLDCFYEQVLSKMNKAVDFKSVYELVCKGHLSEEFLKSDIERFTATFSLDYRMTNFNVSEQISDKEFDVLVNEAYEIVQDPQYSFNSAKALFSFCRNLAFFYEKGTTHLSDNFLAELESFSINALNRCKDITEIDDFQLHNNDNKFLNELLSKLNKMLIELRNKTLSQELRSSLLNALKTRNIIELEKLLRNDREVYFLDSTFVKKLLIALETSDAAELRLFIIFFEKRFSPGHYYEKYSSELGNLVCLKDGVKKILKTKKASLSLYFMKHLEVILSEVLDRQKNKLPD